MGLKGSTAAMRLISHGVSDWGGKTEHSQSLSKSLLHNIHPKGALGVTAESSSSFTLNFRCSCLLALS